jgi:hypothetical protein
MGDGRYMMMAWLLGEHSASEQDAPQQEGAKHQRVDRMPRAGPPRSDAGLLAAAARAQQPMPFPGSGTTPPSVPAVVHVSAYLDRMLNVDDRAYTFQVGARAAADPGPQARHAKRRPHPQSLPRRNPCPLPC